MKRKIVIPSRPRPSPANDAPANDGPVRERPKLGVKFGQGDAGGSSQ